QETTALSRLRFLCTLTAVLALAVALAACGGSGSDKSGESPQTGLNEATFQGIKSGNLELAAAAEAPGKEGGNVDVNPTGPFQRGAKGKLPQLDMQSTATG